MKRGLLGADVGIYLSRSIRRLIAAANSCCCCFCCFSKWIRSKERGCACLSCSRRVSVSQFFNISTRLLVRGLTRRGLETGVSRGILQCTES